MSKPGWIPEVSRESLQTFESRKFFESFPEAVDKKDCTVLEIVRFTELFELRKCAPTFPDDVAGVINEAVGEQADDVMCLDVEEVKIHRIANQKRFVLLKLLPDEYIMDERERAINGLMKACKLSSLPSVFNDYRWEIAAGTIPRGTGVSTSDLSDQLGKVYPSQVILDVLHIE